VRLSTFVILVLVALLPVPVQLGIVQAPAAMIEKNLPGGRGQAQA
jgi:hypothetical protein